MSYSLYSATACFAACSVCIDGVKLVGYDRVSISGMYRPIDSVLDSRVVFFWGRWIEWTYIQLDPNSRWRLAAVYNILNEQVVRLPSCLILGACCHHIAY